MADSPWKQLLPGAIEPEAGVAYEFKNYVGQTWRGVFAGVRPDPLSQTGGLIMALTGTEETPRPLPIWFREVSEE